MAPQKRGLAGRLDIVLHYTESRKITDRWHCVNPGIGVHADNEDAQDLESHVGVTGRSNVRAA